MLSSLRKQTNRTRISPPVSSTCRLFYQKYNSRPTAGETRKAAALQLRIYRPRFYQQVDDYLRVAFFFLGNSVSN